MSANAKVTDAQVSSAQENAQYVSAQESAPCAGASATSTPHLLEVCDLHCGYGKKHEHEIVHGVSFSVDRDEFVCIIGANGCGKTTTLKTMMGLLPAFDGKVFIEGKDMAQLSERERARHFAYIPQAHTPPFPFSVADVVIMGRTPYQNQLAFTSEYDRVIAYQAMQLLDIADLADQPYTNLSGGQQQLVLIARALTQQADVLIMDEPTASLDYGNQHLVLSRMRMLSKLGKSVVMVTHDPDHALYCADRVVVMHDGLVLRDGTPDECITTEVMRLIYNMDACVAPAMLPDGTTERVCVPLHRER